MHYKRILFKRYYYHRQISNTTELLPVRDILYFNISFIFINKMRRMIMSRTKITLYDITVSSTLKAKRQDVGM